MGATLRAQARRVRPAVAWRLEARTRRLRRVTRLATASLRLRPTFLVIGAQKGGTTSLHRYLREHPAVLCPGTKEVHYFSLRYAQGERWYRSLFPLFPAGIAVWLRHGARAAVGEATPAYLFDPGAAARVHAFNGQMRVIAVLRDPVDRAYAHYHMERETRDERRPFEDALAWEEEVLAPELERWFADPAYASLLPLYGRSYVARGRYAEQLERWLRLFPREQLLVLTTDELRIDPGGTMALIARFLGVPERTATSYPLENIREYPSMSPATRDRLARVFEPHNRRLEELLGRELPWVRPRPEDSRADEAAAIPQPG
jgi:Sulfotransferase domain